MLRSVGAGEEDRLQPLSRPRVRVTPRGLVLVNVGCALAGLAQSLYVARAVGAAGLAVIGVLAGALALVANFLDLRPADLASRFFYEQRESGARAGVLQVCFLLNTAVGVTLLLVGSVVALAASRVVLDTTPSAALAVAQSAVTSAALVSGSPVALLRLTERLGVVAAWRIGAQLLSAVCIVAAVAATGTVTGYYVGAVSAAVLQLPVVVLVSVVVWRRAGVDLLSRGQVRPARIRYMGQLRFLVHGSVLGYAKMLHRGADVLLLAFVSSDVATGVYRLARQLSDGLYVVFDAISQVYGPRLLSLLADGDRAQFRLDARRLLVGAAASTALAIAGVLLVMPVVRETVLADQYDGVVVTLAILVLPFGIVTGVHLWLWAVLVHLGRLDVLVAPAIVGAVVQAAFLAGAVPLLSPAPAWAAAAYISYYVIAYAAALAWLARRHRDVLPALGRHSRSAT